MIFFTGPSETDRDDLPTAGGTDSPVCAIEPPQKKKRTHGAPVKACSSVTVREMREIQSSTKQRPLWSALTDRHILHHESVWTQNKQTLTWCISQSCEWMFCSDEGSGLSVHSLRLMDVFTNQWPHEKPGSTTAQTHHRQSHEDDISLSLILPPPTSADQLTVAIFRKPVRFVWTHRAGLTPRQLLIFI